MSTPSRETVHNVINDITLLYYSGQLVSLKDAGIEIAKRVVDLRRESGVGFDGDEPDIEESYDTAALRLIVRLLVDHALDRDTLIRLAGGNVTLPVGTRIPIKSSSDGGGHVAQGGSAPTELQKSFIDLEFRTAWANAYKWSTVGNDVRLDKAVRNSAWNKFNIKPEYYPAGSEDTRHLNTILLGFMGKDGHLKLADLLGLQLRSNLEREKRLKALFEKLTGKSDFNDYSLEIDDDPGGEDPLPLFGLGSYAGAKKGVGFKRWMMFDKKYESHFDQGVYTAKMTAEEKKKGTYSGSPVTMNQYYAQRIDRILEIWANERGIKFEIAEPSRPEWKSPKVPRDPPPLDEFGKLIPLPRYHPYISNAVLPDPDGTKSAELAKEATGALREISFTLQPSEGMNSIEVFRKNVGRLVHEVATTRDELLNNRGDWLREGVKKLATARGMNERELLPSVEEMLTLNRYELEEGDRGYAYSTEDLPNVALLAAKTLFDKLNLGQDDDAGNTAEALRTAVNVILKHMYLTLKGLQVAALLHVVHTPYSKDGSGGDDIQDGDGIPDDVQEAGLFFPPPDLLIPPQHIGERYTRFDGPIYRWLLRARKLQNNKEEVRKFITETSEVLRDAYDEDGAGTFYGHSGIMRPFIRLVGYLLEEAYGAFSEPAINWKIQ